MSDARGGSTSDGESELRFIETTSADDLIEGRSPRPPARWGMRPWWLALLAVVVLVAGIGIGYALGRHTSKPAAAPAPPSPGRPTPAPSLLGGLSSLNSTGDVCYGQPASSRRLMLGVEIVNDGSRPITISSAHGAFPLGGLREVNVTSGQCDETSVRSVVGDGLPPHATEWITVTVDVLRSCPQPLPVWFRVEYLSNGAPDAVTLRAFADLGSVPYSGC